MDDSKLMKVGITGTLIAALCCFTPILSILFVGIGLAALVECLDFILLPLMALFMAITIYALWKKSNAA